MITPAPLSTIQPRPDPTASASYVAIGKRQRRAEKRMRVLTARAMKKAIRTLIVVPRRTPHDVATPIGVITLLEPEAALLAAVCETREHFAELARRVKKYMPHNRADADAITAALAAQNNVDLSGK